MDTGQQSGGRPSGLWTALRVLPARRQASSQVGQWRREEGAQACRCPWSPGLTWAAPVAASGPQYHLLSGGTADRLWEASGQCLAVGQGTPLGLSQTPGLHFQVGSAEGLGSGSSPGACLLPTFLGSSCLGCPFPQKPSQAPDVPAPPVSTGREPGVRLQPRCEGALTLTAGMGEAWMFLWRGRHSDVLCSRPCFCLDPAGPGVALARLVWSAIIYVHGRPPRPSGRTCSLQRGATLLTCVPPLSSTSGLRWWYSITFMTRHS